MEGFIFLFPSNLSNSTVKLLNVAAASIRMKILIFQWPMPKAHLRLLLEILYEKINPRTVITLAQPFMSNGQINICPINQFNAHMSQNVYKIVFFQLWSNTFYHTIFYY